MHLRMRPLLVLVILLTLTTDGCLARTLNAEAEGENHEREKRAIGDFFTKIWSIGSLGKAQYDDTSSSLAKVYEILRDSFSDTFIRKPTITVISSTDLSSSGNDTTPITTTTEKYRISRKELGRILNRNFRGLKRLAQIEKNDANNATKYNIQEYKVQFANSVQSFVYNLPENDTAMPN